MVRVGKFKGKPVFFERFPENPRNNVQSDTRERRNQIAGHLNFYRKFNDLKSLKDIKERLEINKWYCGNATSMVSELWLGCRPETKENKLIASRALQRYVFSKIKR